MCRRKCELAEGLVVEEGTLVWVSMLGLHKDAKYFPDPEKFDPERFNEEQKSKRPSFVYLPFGEGPRSCIGKLRLLNVCLKRKVIQVFSYK